eukprot:12123608-Alexandrium_andersonii.AAC.1
MCWTVASRVHGLRRLRWSTRELDVSWLDEVISSLGLSSDFKRGAGPPSGVDSRLDMSYDLSRCRVLAGTR